MLMLEALPRKEDDPWLFAGRKPGTHMSGIDEVWRIVRELAGLHDVRVHDITASPRGRLHPAKGCRLSADQPWSGLDACAADVSRGDVALDVDTSCDGQHIAPSVGSNKGRKVELF